MNDPAPRTCVPLGSTGAHRRVLLALAVVALAAGCDRSTPATSREAENPAAGAGSRGVVSLSPLATRFVLAIAAGSRLVAVDAESARIEAVAELPAVDLAGALELDPELVLVPELPDAAHPGVAALAQRGGRVAAFAPHDLEDVAALVRDVGSQLVGAAQAGRFEAELSRPLARIGGSSRGQPRPRVAAVVSFDPFVIAGGHSFETDLIEIAGGHSVTHPGEEPRLAIGADQWKELAADLVLVIADRPASPHAERALRNALPPGVEVAFFSFDPAFWLTASAEPAQRLRALVEPIARAMASRGE